MGNNFLYSEADMAKGGTYTHLLQLLQLHKRCSPKKVTRCTYACCEPVQIYYMMCSSYNDWKDAQTIVLSATFLAVWMEFMGIATLNSTPTKHKEICQGQTLRFV